MRPLRPDNCQSIQAAVTYPQQGNSLLRFLLVEAAQVAVPVNRSGAASSFTLPYGADEDRWPETWQRMRSR